MRYIGKIDKRKFSDISNNILTNEVVLTDEREVHIKLRHTNDYELFELYATEIVENPDIILEDGKNIGTVFMIKKLPGTNLNVVVRLVLENENPNLKNSVMTFYRIRNTNLKKLIKKIKRFTKTNKCDIISV